MNLNQRLPDAALKSHGRRSAKTTKQAGNGFCDLGIAPVLLKEIERLSFETPTPVQKESIPVGIIGNDIIAVAQTGSGKTLAFGIPMFQRLSTIKRSTGLVLVPTRELAVQVDEALKTIGRSVHIRSTVLIGGASMTLQQKALKKNPRVIIATPGRLMDHIERKTVKLDNIEVLVLDEADRMLDMGFAPDIKKIMKSIPDKHQTMLFSATMPRQIQAMAEALMDDAVLVETDRSGETPAEVSQEIFFIKHQDKSRLLAVHLKQCSGPVLVFTRTKRMANRLNIKVGKMGFASAEIHSNRSLGQRRNALEGFKRGVYQILIATDIAARGIDVSGIELVVNYDMPANSEDYVHRIGRTGRAGKTGRAISFATSDQKSTIRDIEKFLRTKMVISELPILPSQKLLIKEAEKLKSSSTPSENNKPSKRKPSTNHSSKRKNLKKSGFHKSAKRRVGARKKNLKRKSSNRQQESSDNSNKFHRDKSQSTLTKG